MRSQQHGLIEMPGFLKVPTEKPLLNGGQWHGSTCCRDLRDSRCRLTDMWAKVRQSLVCEQVTNGELDAFFARSSNDLYTENRVAAKFEEVVMAAYVLDTEHSRPDVRQPSFQFRAWSFKELRSSGCFGCRQAATVDLAVGGERQLVEHHELARHHVVGQLPAQALADHRDFQRAGHRQQIRHQLSVLGLTVYPHDRVLDLGLAPQQRLDLPRLDAKTPQLDLLVEPPQELYSPITSPPTAVPRAVQPP